MIMDDERWFEQTRRPPPAIHSKFVARVWRDLADRVTASLSETGEATEGASDGRDPLSGADRRRLECVRAQALRHPLRIGVLGLFTRDTDRSLRASDLLADLAVEDPDIFGDFKVGQVAYHCARPRDAKLLPVGCR